MWGKAEDMCMCRAKLRIVEGSNFVMAGNWLKSMWMECSCLDHNGSDCNSDNTTVLLNYMHFT